MKSKLLSLGLFSFSALMSLAPSLTTPASATCVDTGVTVQIALRDRTKAPAQQTSHTESEIEDDCFGNTATGTSTQIYFGDADQVIQESDRSVYMGGGEDPLAGTGVDTPNVSNHIQIQHDIPLPLDLIPQ